MVILAGAMGLKTAIAGHNNGSVMMANGSAPLPTAPQRNGSDPFPRPF